MHELGIRAIYQTNELVPYFTVGESIMLNNEKRSFGGLVLDKRATDQIAGDILKEQLGVEIDTASFIRNLNVSQQQLVQIAKNLVKCQR